MLLISIQLLVHDIYFKFGVKETLTFIAKHGVQHKLSRAYPIHGMKPKLCRNFFIKRWRQRKRIQLADCNCRPPLSCWQLTWTTRFFFVWQGWSTCIQDSRPESSKPMVKFISQRRLCLQTNHSLLLWMGCVSYVVWQSIATAFEIARSPLWLRVFLFCGGCKIEVKFHCTKII